MFMTESGVMIKDHFNDDGSLLLEFTSGNKYEVISFVLGFGQNAVLLEPASLKDEIAKEIESMQKAYAKS